LLNAKHKTTKVAMFRVCLSAFDSSTFDLTQLDSVCVHTALGFVPSIKLYGSHPANSWNFRIQCSPLYHQPDTTNGIRMFMENE